MTKYHYTYKPDNQYHPALVPNTLFLDIETTGFQRKSTYLTIIGLAWQEENEIIVEQWFNDKGAIGEPILLMELEKLICQMNFPQLIHYNGTTFDLPYLKSKYEQFHLPTSLGDCDSIDLYRIAKKYRNFLDLSGLKQKNLEEAFGLYREDTLSGQELINAYLEGLHYNDTALLDMYLLHNKEDMEGMVFLQNFLKLDCFFHGEFEIVSWDCHSIPAKNASTNDFDYPKVLSSGNDSTLSVTVKADFYLKERLSFSYNGIHITFDCQKNGLKNTTVTVTVPIVEREAKYFYENYKDYFYLPKEDRAIHKSVAMFVEKEFRKKATKETCYIKKTASFLPLPLPENSRLRKACLKECCELELFYDCYGDCMAYVQADKELFDCQKRRYLMTLFQEIC